MTLYKFRNIGAGIGKPVLLALIFKIRLYAVLNVMNAVYVSIDTNCGYLTISFRKQRNAYVPLNPSFRLVRSEAAMCAYHIWQVTYCSYAVFASLSWRLNSDSFFILFYHITVLKSTASYVQASMYVQHP